MKFVDWSDLCVLCGFLLLGFAVWWSLGLVALAVYAGVFLILLGIFLARREL